MACLNSTIVDGRIQLTHVREGAGDVISRFEYTSFAVTDHPDVKLVVYTPLAEEGSVARLEALLRDMASG